MKAPQSEVYSPEMTIMMNGAHTPKIHSPFIELAPSAAEGSDLLARDRDATTNK